jgi:hypothetical protein
MRLPVGPGAAALAAVASGAGARRTRRITRRCASGAQRGSAEGPTRYHRA